MSVTVLFPEPAALRAHFGAELFASASACVDAQQVEDLDLDPHNQSVSARVLRGDQEPYEVRARVLSLAPRLAVASRCTCAQAQGCTHVVATLLAAHALTRPQPGQALPADAAAANDSVESPVAARLRQAWDLWARSAAIAPSVAPISESDPGTREGPDFLLAWSSAEFGTDLRILPIRRTFRSDGSPGAPRVATVELRERTADLLAHDPQLLFHLLLLRDLPMQTVKGQNWRQLVGASGNWLLRQLLETGRLFLIRDLAHPLRLGPPKAGRWDWRLLDDGSQRLRLRADSGEDSYWCGAPWYLNPEQLSLGPLELDLAAATTRQLLLSPAVLPEVAEAAMEALSRSAPDHRLPPPAQLAIVEDVRPLVPRLHFMGRSARIPGHPDEAFARLEFCYGAARAGSAVHEATLRAHENGSLISIPRDGQSEERARQTLSAMGLRVSGAHHEGDLVDLEWQLPEGEGAPDLVTWTHRQRDALEAAGITVAVDASCPTEVLRLKPRFYADLRRSDRNGWFDLELGLEIDGEQIALLPLIAHPENIRFDGDTAIIRIDARRYVAVPAERIRQIQATLRELSDEAAGHARIRAHELRRAVLAELDQAFEGQLHWGGQLELLKSARRLVGAKVAELDPPAGLEATLRPYQLDGYRWLQHLRGLGLSGLLADDMGLGKTVQVLAHLLGEKNAGRLNSPALVIVPTSLLSNWTREANRFAPSLRVLVLHGLDRRSEFSRIHDSDLILTTYPLIVRDIDELSSIRFSVLVLDEAQAVKNHRAKTAQAVRRLQAQQRLSMTGTPLENNLGELWTQFDWLLPGLLGGPRAFQRQFRAPVEKRHDAHALERLKHRVAPFFLRRTKDQVASELPPKTEVPVPVTLGGAQRDLYETVRVSVANGLRSAISEQGVERSRILVLDALLKLRQVCCDPRLTSLVEAERNIESAKLERLLQLLEQAVAEGRRILVFSQFVRMLVLIADEIKAREWPYLMLTGETRDRGAVVDAFQRGEAPILLMSLKAGGVGLNLTAADVVIHYDPWWNPAAEAQASDRAHRIGQDKPVFVYRLIAEGTVEERIQALQGEKQHLADALFGDTGERALSLSADEIESLFGPIE